MKRILFQFCSSKYIEVFEKNHYVRKMTGTGRTDKSKAVGEVRGHHGQQIHYLIWYETDSGWEKVGAISGGSAVYATGVRDEFFRITKENRQRVINGIIDNTFFRLERHEYNLASRIVSQWRKVVIKDWEGLYGVKPYGFETFVEHEEIDAFTQRVGSLYLADNWTRVGETTGKAKNHVGMGLTGGLHGNPFTRENVPKKIVFCKWIDPFTQPQACEYKSSWRGQTPEEKQLAKKHAAWRKLRTAESKAELKRAGVPVEDNGVGHRDAALLATGSEAAGAGAPEEAIATAFVAATESCLRPHVGLAHRDAAARIGRDAGNPERVAV